MAGWLDYDMDTEVTVSWVLGCPKNSQKIVQISTTPNLVYINVLGNQKKY